MTGRRGDREKGRDGRGLFWSLGRPVAVSPCRPIAPSPRRAVAGFTLLEMMVALSVMSIAMIALLRVVVGNVNAVGDARDRTIAASLAQAKLHDIERDPEQQSAQNSGNFGEENKYFSWTSETQETQWPALKRVAVTVSWIRGKVQKQLTVETLFRADQQQDSTDSGAATPGGGVPQSGSPPSGGSPSGPGKGRTP